MKRSDLEHILRASKAVTGETEFIVIGSQCILAKFPDAPRELRQSMEADLYPRFKPDLAKEIEGAAARGGEDDRFTVFPYPEGRDLLICTPQSRVPCSQLQPGGSVHRQVGETTLCLSLCQADQN